MTIINSFASMMMNIRFLRAFFTGYLVRTSLNSAAGHAQGDTYKKVDGLTEEASLSILMPIYSLASLAIVFIPFSAAALLLDAIFYLVLLEGFNSALTLLPTIQNHWKEFFQKNIEERKLSFLEKLIMLPFKIFTIVLSFTFSRLFSLANRIKKKITTPIAERIRPAIKKAYSFFHIGIFTALLVANLAQIYLSGITLHSGIFFGLSAYEYLSRKRIRGVRIIPLVFVRAIDRFSNNISFITRFLSSRNSLYKIYIVGLSLYQFSNLSLHNCIKFLAKVVSLSLHTSSALLSLSFVKFFFPGGAKLFKELVDNCDRRRKDYNCALHDCSGSSGELKGFEDLNESHHVSLLAIGGNRGVIKEIGNQSTFLQKGYRKVAKIFRSLASLARNPFTAIKNFFLQSSTSTTAKKMEEVLGFIEKSKGFKEFMKDIRAEVAADNKDEEILGKEDWYQDLKKKILNACKNPEEMSGYDVRFHSSGPKALKIFVDEMHQSMINKEITPKHKIILLTLLAKVNFCSNGFFMSLEEYMAAHQLGQIQKSNPAQQACTELSRLSKEMVTTEFSVLKGLTGSNSFDDVDMIAKFIRLVTAPIGIGLNTPTTKHAAAWTACRVAREDPGKRLPFGIKAGPINSSFVRGVIESKVWAQLVISSAVLAERCGKYLYEDNSARTLVAKSWAQFCNRELGGTFVSSSAEDIYSQEIGRTQAQKSLDSLQSELEQRQQQPVSFFDIFAGRRRKELMKKIFAAEQQINKEAKLRDKYNQEKRTVDEAITACKGQITVHDFINIIDNKYPLLLSANAKDAITSYWNERPADAKIEKRSELPVLDKTSVKFLLLFSGALGIATSDEEAYGMNPDIAKYYLRRAGLLVPDRNDNGFLREIAQIYLKKHSESIQCIQQQNKAKT